MIFNTKESKGVKKKSEEIFKGQLKKAIDNQKNQKGGGIYMNSRKLMSLEI